MVIGLTGGIASGKSTVAEFFKKLGAEILDTDEIAREIVKPATPAYEEIIKVWGEKVLNPDKTINRKVLGDIIFKNEEERRRLNQITHPQIFLKVQERLLSLSSDTVLVIVVPLLIELGMQELFDYIFVCSCEEEKQIERLISRDGLSPEQAKDRIRSQLPLTEKIKYADEIIDTNVPQEVTEAQVLKIWERRILSRQKEG